jgi:cell wall-associated NlpC family hydrolase
MIEPSAVIAKARELLGVPYRHQGRSHIAVDCIGVIVVVVRDLALIDVDLFIPANYTARPRDGLLERYVASVCVPSEGPVAGGFALFRWAPTAPAAHCAILTGDTMIHSYKTVGRVTEHGFRAKWPERVHSFWKLPGVNYD